MINLSLFVDNIKELLYNNANIFPLKGANILVTKLNVIMKYNRPKPVWVCPDCDTENDLSVENCFTCDRVKPAYARIITPESERQEMEESVTVVNNHYSEPPTTYGSTISPPVHYSSMPTYPKKGPNVGVIVALIVFALIILGIIGFALAYDQGYSGGYYSTFESISYNDIIAEYISTI